MKECKNPTCTRQTKSAYCDRRCQLAMRTVSNGYQLPDLWVGMDTLHLLRRIAERENMTITELVLTEIDELVLLEERGAT